MRKLGLAVVGLILLLALTAGALTLYVRSALPPVNGTVAVAGLVAPVQLWRDSLGIPTLQARDERDLFFAQGYVHAQERLWQMELLRRTVDGRLAELFGSELIGTDRFLRTLGLGRAAAVEVAQLGPEEKVELEAYAEGVNAWITNTHGALPPEFLALRVRPEPWTVRNTLGIEQAMALDLSTYWTASAAARAVHRLGVDRARWLFPAYPRWGVTILEGPSPASADRAPREEPAPKGDRVVLDAAGSVHALPPAMPAGAAALLGAASITRASNAWVVGGERTRSGKPILANDMHLELRAPSIWMLMGLHAPGFDVVGMTIPGVPFVVAGHNGAVAWGFTNAYLDDFDFFIERLDPSDSTRYLVPGGSAAFEVRTDTVHVRGAEPVSFRVRTTRHGPVLEDARTDSGFVLSAEWASTRPSPTLRGIPAFDRARDWASFLRAARDFQNPHQNLVYADTAGHFGYVMAGRAPLRGSGRPPPIGPVPGWTGEWDWNGWLPFEEHPQVLDPPRGFVVTANNRQTWGYPADRISTDWEEPFRAQRIRELILSAREPLDAAAVQRMQADVGDAMAARYRDRAVDAAVEAGREAVADSLRRWDLRASLDSRAAGFFYTWFETLRALAGADLWGQDDGWFPNPALTAVLERRALPWRDAGGATAYDSLAARAMRRADSLAAGRRWGEINRVSDHHALAASGLLDRLLDLDIGPAPRDGSPYTVNVSHLRGRTPPYATWAAPSQRHVVDMADVDGSGGFILPTGESGLPFSPHYSDQFRLWLGGALRPIPLDLKRAAARTVHRLTLEPAKTEQ